MWKNEKLTLNKAPDFNELLTFGFIKTGDGYSYSAGILQGAFSVNLFISQTGVFQYEIIDTSTDEEYVLAYSQNTEGAFIGRVRSECEKLLLKVINACFKPCVFKQDNTKRVLDYAHSAYGTRPEFLWEDTPNNAILRNARTGKWYAAILTVEYKKLGVDKDGLAEVINLKNKTENIEKLIDGKGVFRAYHMNKKHWYTVLLDGAVEITKIYRLIDTSFNVIDDKK